MLNIAQFPESETGVQPVQVSEQRIQKETIIEFIR
jgi:hypothetical protein